MAGFAPIFPINTNGPNYLLGQAVITFHTTDDDKDPDTFVDIKMMSFNHGVRGVPFINYRGDFGGHLPSGSTKKMNLPFTTGTIVTDGTQYVLDIVIEPKGHDTWKFDLTLDVDFQADRSTRHQYFPGQVLSQNNLKGEYVFYL